MSTQRAGIEGRKEGRAVNVVEVHSDGRKTDGRGRTQELPAQTPQSADLRGREREDRKRRRSFSEASTDSVSCQGGQRPSQGERAGHTKQFGRNKSQKDGNDQSTDRSIEKSEKANEEILGENNANEATTSVSHLLVLCSPLLSMVTFCRRRLRPFLCKSLCYATINKEGGRQAGRMARPSQRRSCRSWDG